MKIAILQFAPKWLDLQSNLEHLKTLCNQLETDTDLLLLPEMFNVGYVLDTSQLNYQWQAITILTLQELAATFNICIGGSIPMFRQGKWYNTFIFVDNTGLRFHYDKIHLFSLAGEERHYTHGSVTRYFNFKGYNILPLVCYDLRFPYLSFTDNIPDIIIYSANWPVSRIHHWKSLLTARAIENLCYVIGINRVGTDNNGFEYPGNSCMINYNGNMLIKLDNQTQVSTFTIDKTQMQPTRQHYGFINDRRF